MTLQQILNNYSKKLRLVSTTPQLDLVVILSFILQKPKEFLYTYPEYELTNKEYRQFIKLYQRRLQHEPIAYLINNKEFYGLNFTINQHTLIPRPATETLVTAVIEQLNNSELNNQQKVLIDIGTGSGCIPIAILKNNPDSTLITWAVDLSNAALKIAKKNAVFHQVIKKINFIKSDLLTFVFKPKYLKLLNNKQLIITANLPYISTKQYKNLAPDLKFEPKNALVSGIDGLNHYKKLFNQLEKLTKLLTDIQITLLIEVEPKQISSIKQILKTKLKKQVQKIKTKKDLAGKQRIMIIKLG